MRVLIILCVILLSIDSVAQIKKDGVGPAQYIGTDELTGSSDAVIVGDVPLIHTKQFLPVDKNGKIVSKDNLSGQLDQVFENIIQTLNEIGSDAGQIVKLNIFLKNAGLIREVQSLITRKFPAGSKPSVTFAAGDLVHPDALISIDAVAISDLKAGSVKFYGAKEQSAAALLPAGPVVYISGQAAKGGLAEATRSTLKQLGETLTSLGLTLKDVVQIKSFLTPMSSLSIVEKEFAEFFKNEAMPPLVFVDWISADPVIEIELIAASRVKDVKADQIDYITPPGMTASPVYAKVTRLNYGKKVYLSGIYGIRADNTDSELTGIFGTMEKVLKASGSDFKNLLKATYYIRSDQYSKSLSDLRPKYYDPSRPPAASKAMIKGIGLNGAGISIDMIGTIKE